VEFSKYSLCPQARRTLGETPLHFPERYGKLVGVKNRPKGDEQEFMLTYEIDEVMTSLVTLQISADDIILIYNRLQYKFLTLTPIAAVTPQILISLTKGSVF